MSEFWRHFQNADNQLFEFYRHNFESENGLKKAQTSLQKGHCCDATVALSLANCSPFTSSESTNGKVGGLFQWFKPGFPLWLEDFAGCVPVNIIRHCPASCGTSFHLFLLVCAPNILFFFSRLTTTIPFSRIVQGRVKKKACTRPCHSRIHAFVVWLPLQVKHSVGFRQSAYCCFFSRSRISVSSFSSAVGSGAGASGAGVSSFFLRASLLIPFTSKNTQKAMMVKSISVWRKLP